MTSPTEMCRICRVKPADSFEHVPPRKAFNDEPSTSFNIMDWLAREEGGLTGGKIDQRGAGDAVLCHSCNNNTGSWYGAELVRAARAGARILGQLQLDELDQHVDPAWATVVFKQQPKIGPHPLRLVKQIIAMLLATSPYDFSVKNPDLGDFVLDRERTGLDPRYQLYLALFAGPNARSTGVASRIDVETGRSDILIEVAYPPYAYVMTVDSESEAIDTANITQFGNVGYKQMADLDLGMLVGFGHTPFPADYRSAAMIERDRKRNDAATAR
jgi:hypothetical protein